MIIYKGNQSAPMGYHNSIPIWDGIKSTVQVNWFYIKSITNNNTPVYLNYYTYIFDRDIQIEYSFDRSEWIPVTIPFINSGGQSKLLLCTIPAGGTVYLRCDRDGEWFWGRNRWTYTYAALQVDAPNYVTIGGDIMSMMYGSRFAGNNPLVVPKNYDGFQSYSFGRLFYQCTGLKDASDLKVPDDIVLYCYYGMFDGCTSLETAPMLGASVLVDSCYRDMFNGCSSLTNVRCNAISGININNSTNIWLNNVAAGGTFYKNKDASWPTGVNGIPSGWTVMDL